MMLAALSTPETNGKSRVSIQRNSALCGLSGSGATIHWQVDSSDEAALVGSEEYGCRRNLVRCSKSSHWDHLLEVIACTFVRCFSADMDHGRLRRSRTDDVRSNAAAGQLCGPGPDKGDQSGFCRRIRAEARYAHLPCGRSGKDDGCFVGEQRERLLHRKVRPACVQVEVLVKRFRRRFGE